MAILDAATTPKHAASTTSLRSIGASHLSLAPGYSRPGRTSRPSRPRRHPVVQTLARKKTLFPAPPSTSPLPWTCHSPPGRCPSERKSPKLTPIARAHDWGAFACVLFGMPERIPSSDPRSRHPDVTPQQGRHPGGESDDLLPPRCSAGDRLLPGEIGIPQASRLTPVVMPIRWRNSCPSFGPTSRTGQLGGDDVRHGEVLPASLAALLEGRHAAGVVLHEDTPNRCRRAWGERRGFRWPRSG